MESCLFKGTVHHERRLPTQHAFDYQMYFFWLKLSEIESLSDSTRGFACNSIAPYQFRSRDYLTFAQPQSIDEMDSAIRKKMRELGAEKVDGDLFFMGQIRALGIFFSPVNFYFHRQHGDQDCNWMLAEVSNTPWNQRHYYLVNMSEQSDSQKAFHVSPFNPIDMQYKWQIAQPSDTFNMALSCYQQQRHFTASLALRKQPLNSRSMTKLILKMPSTTLFSVVGIYWQALKLFLKRTPVYSHPGTPNNSVQENNNVSK